MKKPILVIPKGRLYNNIKELFESKGINLPESNVRQYFYPDWSDDCALFIAKPKAIPQLIHTKYAEFGFCGKDIFKNSEYESSVYNFYDTGLTSVKICLCAKNYTLDELLHLKRPIIVATEFTHIASTFFTQLGVPHYILDTTGSTEGYLDINADCIIDVVDTGETLKENNIDILKVLFESTTCLYEHRDLCDCTLPKNIQKLLC